MDKLDHEQLHGHSENLPAKLFAHRVRELLAPAPPRAPAPCPSLEQLYGLLTARSLSTPASELGDELGFVWEHARACRRCARRFLQLVREARGFELGVPGLAEGEPRLTLLQSTVATGRGLIASLRQLDPDDPAWDQARQHLALLQDEHLLLQQELSPNIWSAQELWTRLALALGLAGAGRGKLVLVSRLVLLAGLGFLAWAMVVLVRSVQPQAPAAKPVLVCQAALREPSGVKALSSAYAVWQHSLPEPTQRSLQLRAEQPLLGQLKLNPDNTRVRAFYTPSAGFQAVTLRAGQLDIFAKPAPSSAASPGRQELIHVASLDLLKEIDLLSTAEERDFAAVYFAWQRGQHILHDPEHKGDIAGRWPVWTSTDLAHAELAESTVRVNGEDLYCASVMGYVFLIAPDGSIRYRLNAGGLTHWVYNPPLFADLDSDACAEEIILPVGSAFYLDPQTMQEAGVAIPATVKLNLRGIAVFKLDQATKSFRQAGFLALPPFVTWNQAHLLKVSGEWVLYFSSDSPANGFVVRLLPDGRTEPVPFSSLSMDKDGTPLLSADQLGDWYAIAGAIRFQPDGEPRLKWVAKGSDTAGLNAPQCTSVRWVEAGENGGTLICLHHPPKDPGDPPYSQVHSYAADGQLLASSPLANDSFGPPVFGPAMLRKDNDQLLLMWSSKDNSLLLLNETLQVYSSLPDSLPGARWTSLGGGVIPLHEPTDSPACIITWAAGAGKQGQLRVIQVEPGASGAKYQLVEAGSLPVAGQPFMAAPVSGDESGALLMVLVAGEDGCSLQLWQLAGGKGRGHASA